eukprot:TRINITY_DN8083_c0_g1_i12.p1 TRINITY_DN8083_c0_g1~~TRINITY_DN8083_c0_g1_i12.p1  ORF type:complete len:184 (+),score=26.52 TRINITY_DN8083_c0_g1_i12:430-981(+)
MWLRFIYIIRYIQIPDQLCSKYYKTVFYLRLQALMELLEIAAFVILLAIILLTLSLERCRVFCPIVIRLHPFLIYVGGLLSDRAGSIAIKFVTNNLSKTKYNPDVHDKHECIICRGEYVKDEEMAELPCDKRHYFHESCIVDWIVKAKSTSCPICCEDAAKELTKAQEQGRSIYTTNNAAVNV